MSIPVVVPVTTAASESNLAAKAIVASESGTVSVFRVAGKKVTKMDEQFVAQRAHSIAVDLATHLLYLPLQNVRGRPVLRIMAPERRRRGGA